MRLVVRILLCIVNALVALSLLCCLLAQYINPSSFPYFELLALGFPVLFAINIGCALFWLFAKDHKLYCLISLSVILLSVPVTRKYYSFASKKQQETKTNTKLKIMSYNVMGFMYFTWRKSTEVKQQIFLYIRKENPDVICFQEYHNDTHENFIVIDSLKQQLNLAYTHHNRVFSVGPHHYQGNMICSRYPIAASGYIDYEQTGNSSIWADIVVGNDTIRIFNSHLESYRLSKDNKQTVNDIGKISKTDDVEVNDVEDLVDKLKRAMIKRGEQIDELAEEIAKSPYPSISCGDFNSPPCSYTYHTIKSANNYQDAFLEAGKGIGATFNWWPQLRLDYILVDSKFKCHRFKRFGLKVSDHFPISCEIDVAPTK